MSQSPTRQALTTRRADNPVTVPFAASPAGEPPGMAQWAHRAVWTDRMVATRWEDNVRGGTWPTLLNERWPNAFFADHGFTSLNDAHIRFVRSIGTS